MPDVDLPLPFEAYVGELPYIFVSYAHKDGQHVFRDIRSLHSAGYRIWYDEGIDPGNEWPDEIAKALDKAEVFLVFISKHAVESRNVRNEINYALNRQKSFLAVYLEEVVLPPGLQLRMGDIQAIMKWRMDGEHYVRKINKVLPASTKGASSSTEGPLSPVPVDDFEIQWSVSLRGTQYSPIRAILPAGREILCLSGSSPETWIYAVHRDSGKLLWQIGAAQDGRVKLRRMALTEDYLYLAGDIEVEDSLCFARKVWLREGDVITAVSWYETPRNRKEKYTHFPEWDSLRWRDVVSVEGLGLECFNADWNIEIHSGSLRMRNNRTGTVLRWAPPDGHITALVILGTDNPVVAFCGRVCRLRPR